jgi:hypothetical protein
MTRSGFQKSVRMFHKFSEETMRRRGGNQAGRDSITALAALESVLKAERLFDASLLEPLAGFTNLLQSSQLPPEFGNYSFGDGLAAIEEAHAELRQNEEQRWEFEPELKDDSTASLTAFLPQARGASSGEHPTKLRRFVLDAASSAQPKTVLVVGALRCPDLPLAELAARAERLTLSDLDLPRLEALVRHAVPEAHRARVQLERYDVTGSYVAFARGVQEVVDRAKGTDDAIEGLAELLASYDVGGGSAGLSTPEAKPDLAISAMLLPELGQGYRRTVENAFKIRGFDSAVATRQPLAGALTLLTRLAEHHHIAALLRRAHAAVLVSAVSQLELDEGPNGQVTPSSEPRDLLGVEQLLERFPSSAEPKAEASWEWRQPRATGASTSVVSLIEAVFV